MTYQEALDKLDEFYKELVSNPDITAIILITDAQTGKCRYMNTGFLEIQALLLKLYLQSNPALSITVVTGGPSYPTA